MMDQIGRNNPLNVSLIHLIMDIKERFMFTVSSTEFRNHYKEYAKKAEAEEICVTSNGKPIFLCLPYKKATEGKARSFFDLLPAGARIGKDEDERDW